MIESFNEVRKAASIQNLKKGMENPTEVVDFLRYTLFRARLDLEEEREMLPSRITSVFDADRHDVNRYFTEISENEEFYSEFHSRHQELEEAGVLRGTTGALAAQAMYVVCRIVEPETVVETGVLYGSFDAHITAALEKNGTGEMHSIDLPGGVDEFDYGYLIPDEYMSRWSLHLGDSREILPDVFDEVGPADVFLHDALHTREHMRWEFETAYPNLTDDGVLASHDIAKNPVFGRYADSHAMEWAQVGTVGFAQK